MPSKPYGENSCCECFTTHLHSKRATKNDEWDERTPLRQLRIFSRHVTPGRTLHGQRMVPEHPGAWTLRRVYRLLTRSAKKRRRLGRLSRTSMPWLLRQDAWSSTGACTSHLPYGWRWTSQRWWQLGEQWRYVTYALLYLCMDMEKARKPPSYILR